MSINIYDFWIYKNFKVSNIKLMVLFLKRENRIYFLVLKIVLKEKISDKVFYVK